MPTTFTGNEGKFITLTEGADFTQAYRDDVGDTQNKAYFFGKNKLAAILSQEGCVGIRVYFGLDKKTGKYNFVLVGATSNENDMTEGYILDNGVPCPTMCGNKNSLNS
jgi:hypothetical protein